MQVPDDRLVSLLRVSTVRSRDRVVSLRRGKFPVTSTRGATPNVFQPSDRLEAWKMLVLLACLAGVLGFSVPGCSFGGGNATLSPEAQAKAKENFKKRFANFGEKTEGPQDFAMKSFIPHPAAGPRRER